MIRLNVFRCQIMTKFLPLQRNRPLNLRIFGEEFYEKISGKSMYL